MEVELQCKCSYWSAFEFQVHDFPHTSYPLKFLIFVNDLPEVFSKCTVNLYTDDTIIYYTNKDPMEVISTLNADLNSIVMNVTG